MNVYRTEDEQVEQLKRILKSYGPAVIIGIILALLINYGWQYYERKHTETREAAATEYQALLNADTQGDVKAVKRAADTLMQQFPTTPYAGLAAMVDAKLAVDAHDIPAASRALTWVTTHSKDSTLTTIASIRLARIDIASNHAEAALSRLASLHDTPYDGLIEETRGDAYAALHKTTQALTAYQAAIAALPPEGQPWVHMKIEHLGKAS
jgi:predicted negative regulator of RcsB-dependent stress response